MKTQLLALAIFLAFAAGNYTGVRGGEYWQQRIDHHDAVAADAAHYDPHTGNFVFGSAQSANLVALDLNEVMEPPKPLRKPARFP